MATVLDTFITRFGFETDKTGLDKAEKGMKDFKSNAIKIAAAVGGILAGGFFLKAIAETADETLKWADANGLAMESLGTLEFAVQRQGGSINGLRASLSNMNKSIGEVQRGTGRAKLAFEDYDLSIKKADGSIKTADELLLDLNKKFATLSRAQQFDLAMKMGIDKGTIRLLQTAPDEIARLRLEAAKLGVLSRRDAVKAAEFVDGMTNIAQVLQSIKFEIGGLVFKPLADFFKIIASGIAFFKDHKKMLLSIAGIIGLVGAAYGAMAVKAVLAWAAAFLPFTLVPILIGAAVTALAILMEDLFAFFSGADSAIGDFLKQFPKIEQGFRKFGEFLGFLTFEVVRGFQIWWDWILKINKGLTDFLLSPIKTITKLFSKIPGFSISSNMSPGAIGAPSPASSILTKSNRAISQTSSVRIGTLNVDASGGDSKEIAQNVDAALKNQLQNTVEDVDSTIER